MISKSSIHIDHGHAGHYSHNSRESFSHSQIFSNEKNEYYNDAEAAIEIYAQELHLRSKAHTKRTNQKVQDKTVTHLAAIINLHDHHSLDDLQPICEYLEETLDTVITQLAIHKDEGKLINKDTGEILTSGIDFFMDPSNNKLYYDKEYTEDLEVSDWEEDKNIHGHAEMLGLDSNGKSIKRNRLSKYYLGELQSFVAETLGMERGQKRESYTREQMEHIKSNMKPREEYKDKKDYGSSFNRLAKQLGYFIPKKKRLDTHAYKSKMKSQNEIDNEKRKARGLLEEKNKQLKNRQLSLLDRDNEIVVLRQKVLDLENVKRVADEKEISDELMISHLEKDVKYYAKEYKAIEENSRKLVYAKGWKRNGEPVKKDDVIKYLNEKGKKANSEKQDYVDKYNVLLDDNKEMDDTNAQLLAENQDLLQELQHSSLGVNSLSEEVRELKDEVVMLRDKIQQLGKDKIIIPKKEHSIQKDVLRSTMRP